MKLGPAGQQLLQRCRILGIVFGHHPVVGIVAGLLEDILVIFRQRIPLFEIDHGEEHGTTLPPSGIVVVRRHLIEAELFVVIGTHPFRRIDGALFQCRIYVAAGELLRNTTQLLHHTAGKAADAEFQSLEVVDGIDFLTEPAAHLTGGIAREQRSNVVALVELVQKFLAATQHVPGLIETRIRPERYRRAECEGRILAEIIVRRSVTHLDGAILYGVEYLQAGDDFAGGEGLDLEFVIGGFADYLGHHLGAAMQRIERFRPAGCHAPFDLRHRLRNCRRGDGGASDAQACHLDKVSSLH